MSDEPSDPIQVAFCADENYLYPLSLAIYSLIRRTKRNVLVHVVGQGLSEKAQASLQNLVGQYGKSIEFHDAAKHNFELPELSEKYSFYISNTTYLRLVLPEFIQGRVIYLDCDILIKDDIGGLWDQELGEHFLGAVQDQGALYSLWSMDYYANKKNPTDTDKRRYQRNLRGVEYVEDFTGKGGVDHYFNAGILLIDCDKLRANTKLYGEISSFQSALKDGGGNDQDHLNRIVGKDYTKLPLIYNAQGNTFFWARRVVPKDRQNEWRNARKHPVIIHYTGSKKPWKSLKTDFSWRLRSAFVQYWAEMWGFKREFGGQFSTK